MGGGVREKEKGLRGDSGGTLREEKMAGSIQCTQLEQEMLLARRNKEKVKEGQRTEREREREREREKLLKGDRIERFPKDSI